MSPEHKALLIRTKGGRMELGTRATPTPGPGQVLVRNITVSINLIDSYMQLLGLFVEDRLPAVSGMDAAGEVILLGSNVQGWQKGDKVFYGCHMVNDRSTFQEYTVVDAPRMAKVPDNITLEQAATIPLGLATAALGIYPERKDALRPDGFDLGGAGLTPFWTPEGRGKYAGQAALVVGGSSSVGQFALQCLKASGFSPLITTASRSNEAYCRAAGATHVIDYQEVPYAELPAAIRKIVGSGETPLNFVYDAMGKDGSQQIAFSLLAPGGSMVSAVPTEVGERAQDDALGRRVVRPFGGVNEECHLAFGAEMYGHLTELVAEGVIKPNNVKLLDGGLEAIPAGCDELLKGVSGVKLVVRIAD